MRVETTLRRRVTVFTPLFVDLLESFVSRKLRPKLHCGDIFETEILHTNSDGNIRSNFHCRFYGASAKLRIEIDGQSHLENSQIEYDQARTEYLESLGYKVIRFMNDDIRYNINAVITRIIEEAELRSRELQTS